MNFSEENFPIKQLICHVTATSDLKDFSAKDIDDWHKQNGWLSQTGKHIGYHYVVRRSGLIEKGREDFEIGSHVYGHNRHTVGIVWVGLDKPEPAQYLVLVHLMACLARKYGLTEKDICGHREAGPGIVKTCPNLDCDQLRADIRIRMAEKVVEGDGRVPCDLVGGACGCGVVKP